MQLIIAEKPSVGKDIAKIVGASSTKEGFLQGGSCLVSWCIGHLVELAPPEEYTPDWKGWKLATLPMLPETFQHRVNASRAKQFEIVSRLMNDPRITEVVCATDAGREGQLIFMYVYLLSGCTKPVKRLWINSMTDEAIRQGFASLKDNREYENLYQSARSRAEADWLVGMNATRLFSVKYNTKLTVGRVQTPTLAMIVNRQQAILNFVPEPFYEIEADCGAFKATWFNGEGTRISGREGAEAIVAKCSGQEGTVIKLNRKKATADRPLLYDLTELQREANRRYGYTANQTLDAAQALYEKHKLATYPRTDSRYLSSDMKAELPGLVKAVHSGFREGAPHAEQLMKQGLNIDKRVINDTKVTDHHAIIVTPNIARYNPARLDEKENNLLRLIVARFLCVLAEKLAYDQTDIELVISEEYFKASGKKITNPGWKAIEDALLGKVKNPETEEEPEQFITLNKGDKLTPQAINLLSRTTSPPKYYTEDTLLSAMETAGKAIEDEALREEMKGMGLGTPATRASIIEKLITVGYVERKKKNLLATAQGVRLISLVPDRLRLPDLTAEWESRLSQIAGGQAASQEFMGGIRAYVADIVAEAAATGIDRMAFSGREALGKCPRCGKLVYENSKSFYCSGYRNEPKCSFSMWKSEKFFTDKGKELTPEIVRPLLAEGKVKMTGLKKRAGDGVYDATVLLQDTGTYVNYRLSFD